MNATANTVNNIPVITIQEPGAKATNAQLRVIGHAVKENQLERFDENAWKNMTKGQAAEIITKLYADHGELPASQAQKTKLGDLFNNLSYNKRYGRGCSFHFALYLLRTL